MLHMIIVNVPHFCQGSQLGGLLGRQGLQYQTLSLLLLLLLITTIIIIITIIIIVITRWECHTNKPVYECMALAKNTPVLREAMLLYFEQRRFGASRYMFPNPYYASKSDIHILLNKAK